MKNWAVIGIIVIVTAAVAVPILTRLPTAQHENAAENLMSKDTDNDGLPDYMENQLGTNPLIADSDNDGLSDGEEVNSYGTNPLSSDADNDNLSDFAELFTYHTDPNVADTDNDGLSDFSEINIGTDPTRWDTDDDGLSDGRENGLGTSPLSPDTDKDGIWDGYEVENMAQYGANPRRRDIFIEIDKMDDENVMWLVENEKSTLISVFENAPIQNPDGSRGVDLHLFENDLLPYIKLTETTWNADFTVAITSMLAEKTEAAMDNYIRDYKSYGEGFYYCVPLNGQPRSGGIDFTVLRNQQVTSNGSLSTFAHELGHSLGLGLVFDGIDSDKYTFEEYPSVMNYNYPSGYVDYSGGGVFNDWQYLQENGFKLHDYYYNF